MSKTIYSMTMMRRKIRRMAGLSRYLLGYRVWGFDVPRDSVIPFPAFVAQSAADVKAAFE